MFTGKLTECSPEKEWQIRSNVLVLFKICCRNTQKVNQKASQCVSFILNHRSYRYYHPQSTSINKLHYLMTLKICNGKNKWPPWSVTNRNLKWNAKRQKQINQCKPKVKPSIFNHLPKVVFSLHKFVLLLFSLLFSTSLYILIKHL